MIAQSTKHFWTGIDWKWTKHKMHPQRIIVCNMDPNNSQGYLGNQIGTTIDHYLFSFMRAMKEGWQMNGRWKKHVIEIELFNVRKM